MVRRAAADGTIPRPVHEVRKKRGGGGCKEPHPRNGSGGAGCYSEIA